MTATDERSAPGGGSGIESGSESESESDRDLRTDPDPGTHYRASDDAPVSAGIYRVVGRDDGRVTLLRVGDRDGARIHPGTLVYVRADELAALDAADPPRATGGAVGATVAALWLTVRQMPRNCLARPGQTALGVGLLIAAATAGVPRER